MNNPTQDGQSIDNASQYTSGLDVHYSSGVYNKAFYLLGTTSGWTTRKAFQVYLKANKTYWSANDTWNQSGNGVLAAACDFGFNVDDVQATLVAVGITSTAPSGCGGTTPPPPPPPPPTGGTLTNGVSVTGLAAATGADLNYTMVVPSGALA
jgi:vibriolysin